MGIYEVTGAALLQIAPLFEGYEETMVWSCLEGCMGQVWTDSIIEMKSVQLVIADFCFFAGEVSEELVLHRPKTYRSDFVIMVPLDEKWGACIKRLYGEKAKKVSRYAMKKDADCFEKQHLTTVVEELNPCYQLHRINKKLYDKVRAESWSSDLCAHFRTYEEYARHGAGVVATYQGKIVAGASSYTYYQGGIEIEVDTHKDYRRLGLALACTAKLILICLEQGRYPSWDAQNLGSVKLAEKLGYHFSYEYIAFEVIW